MIDQLSNDQMTTNVRVINRGMQGIIVWLRVPCIP